MKPKASFDQGMDGCKDMPILHKDPSAEKATTRQPHSVTPYSVYATPDLQSFPYLSPLHHLREWCRGLVETCRALTFNGRGLARKTWHSYALPALTFRTKTWVARCFTVHKLTLKESNIAIILLARRFLPSSFVCPRLESWFTRENQSCGKRSGTCVAIKTWSDQCCQGDAVSNQTTSSENDLPKTM